MQIQACLTPKPGPYSHNADENQGTGDACPGALVHGRFREAGAEGACGGATRSHTDSPHPDPQLLPRPPPPGLTELT